MKPLARSCVRPRTNTSIRASERQCRETESRRRWERQHFTLKENTLKRTDLDDFVACYFGEIEHGTKAKKEAGAAPTRHNRKESDRFKSFTYDEVTKRDKANLDIFWLKDE